MILNFLFLVQAAFAGAVAFAMFFATHTFTWLATGHVLGSGVTADVAIVYAREAALGALLVALVCATALASGRRSVRWPSLLALLAICVASAATGLLLVPFEPMKSVVVGFHGLLAVAYVLVTIFLPHEI